MQNNEPEKRSTEISQLHKAILRINHLLRTASMMIYTRKALSQSQSLRHHHRAQNVEGDQRKILACFSLRGSRRKSEASGLRGDTDPTRSHNAPSEPREIPIPRKQIDAQPPSSREDCSW